MVTITKFALLTSTCGYGELIVANTCFPVLPRKCAQIILAKHPSFGVSSLIILLKEVQELCLSSAAVKFVISYIIYINYYLNARLQEREPFVQEG